jgi:hypothetical protein
MPASTISVAPSCQLSSPPSSLLRPIARAEASAICTIGSSAATSAGGTPPISQSIAGGCARSQGSVAAARPIQSSNSRATRLPKPCSSACSGRYSMWQSRRHEAG